MSESFKCLLQKFFHRSNPLEQLEQLEQLLVPLSKKEKRVERRDRFHQLIMFPGGK